VGTIKSIRGRRTWEIESGGGRPPVKTEGTIELDRDLRKLPEESFKELLSSDARVSNFDTPSGYRRESSAYRLSQDGRRIDFEFLDAAETPAAA